MSVAFQSREDWLRWRKDGIGGSDMNKVMGVSKYGNVLTVYEDKIEREIKEEKESFQAKWGTQLEPRIRAMFETLMSGEEFKEIPLQDANFPHRRVSLDGRSNRDFTRICEIKLLGKDDYALAKNSIVPPSHVPQVQYNIGVAQADICYYVCYPWENKNDKVIDPDLLIYFPVAPDYQYIVQLFEAADKLWFEHILPKKPPLQPSETIKLTGLSKRANRLKRNMKKIDELQSQVNEDKKFLIEAAKECGADKAVCNGIKLSLCSRSGSVEYSKIPELTGVDLDKYRKPGSTYWKMDLPKEETKK